MRLISSIRKLITLSAGRVPVVLQMSSNECGAACLAMILGHYRHNADLLECRELCGSGRDGASAQAIASAARRYGLRPRGYSMEPENFKLLRLPAIAHWNFNHFVVVEKWSPRSVQIVDPAVGRRRLSPAEFDAGFTGVALAFEEGSGSTVGPLRRRDRLTRVDFVAYVLRTSGVRGLLAQIIGASLLLQVLGLGLPLMTKIVVDDVLPLRTTSLMTILAAAGAMWVLAQAATTYLRAALLIYLQARIDSRMMLDFFEHLLSLPFSFFQQRASGDLIMRLSSNRVLREILTGQTVSAALDGSLVVVYLVTLTFLYPLFAAVAFTIGAIQVALLIATTAKMHLVMHRELLAQAEAQSYAVEALNGIATLKASGAEDQALNRWTNLFFNQLNANLYRTHLGAAIETAMSALRTLSPLVLLWIGAMQVLNGRMSLGSMLAVNALAAAFLTPLSSLVSSGQQIQLAGAHLDRITDVLGAEPEQLDARTGARGVVSGQIAFEDVSFRYDPSAELALANVSFKIDPGRKVAVVGRTGSGKSTIAKLVLGLYNPSDGRVLCDGETISSYDLRDLRRQFGVVLQESFLFSGTVRQNISFNDPSMPLDRVIESARLAAIHEEIIRMPMGYETLISEGGSALSGGQRQRLSIARAVAHHPAVLVLDEATSHLDALTEEIVDCNLESLSCTRLVIAHRLSTVRNADQIIVLDQGRIVEQGGHEGLLSAGGYYYELFHSQLADRSANG
jgi:ATP-binding cassette subfamily B protein